MYNAVVQTKPKRKKTKMAAGTKVTDGFFVYEVIVDTQDGWLTVRLSGHVFRIQSSQVVLN